jgi:hypothetical protein
MNTKLWFTLVLSSVGFLSGSRAQTVTYSFEPPQLTVSQSTPFLNLVPDVASGFRASFTAPTGGSFSVTTFSVSPSFSGQSLLDGSGPADTLRVTLNTPITDLEVDFALMAGSGHLELQSSAGSITAYAVPSTQYGTLVFHSATSFTQFDLLGFSAANIPSYLAIDNLTMTAVPEPDVVALLALAALTIAARRVPRRS